MPTSELVKVSVTPQGTADVYIGELHIKTFGGVSAHQAASDFAEAIRTEFNKAPIDLMERWQANPELLLKTPECDKCFEEEGSYTCIRAAHKLGEQANVQSETRKPR